MKKSSWQTTQRYCVHCGRSNDRNTDRCQYCDATQRWSVVGLARHSYQVVARAIVYLLVFPVLLYMVADLLPWRIQSVVPTADTAGTTCVVWRLQNEPLLSVVSACTSPTLQRYPYTPWLDRTVVDAHIAGAIAGAAPVVAWYAPVFQQVDVAVTLAQQWLNQQVRSLMRRLPWYEPPQWPHPDTQAQIIAFV